MNTAKNSVHPLVRKVRSLQGDLTQWRYTCGPKKLQTAMWLEDELEQLARWIEAVTYSPAIAATDTPGNTDAIEREVPEQRRKKPVTKFRNGRDNCYVLETD